MTAPVLDTDRLILRGHRVGDVDAVAALWANPEVLPERGPGLFLADAAVQMLTCRFARPSAM